MDLNKLTFNELRKYIGEDKQVSDKPFVIVRCRDAGVHAGYLEDGAEGRACTLTESRRLWYWKCANNASFLSGVATEGLDSSSKVGAPITITLTENCEIIQCTAQARESILAQPSYKR